jgi:hypothetical protein
MRWLVISWLLLAATPASALVIDSATDSATSDPTTRAPAPDPGWANVGMRGATTAIYLGNGWVITANHVGAGDIVLGGVTYRAVPESARRLGEGGPLPLPDLIVFRIEPHPDLPALRIRPGPPEVGNRVLMIGAGRERGARIHWGGQSGWSWSLRSGMRWATNRVHAIGFEVVAGGTRTPSFSLCFDRGETRYEAQAALGDSGGAVFIRRRGQFELAGVLVAILGYPGQPAETALYGNFSTAADLSVHRRFLVELLAQR